MRAQQIDRRALIPAWHDLAMEASFTRIELRLYSPYIASLDIARIFELLVPRDINIFRLASLHGDKLALTLNAAPSFHQPDNRCCRGAAAVETPQLRAVAMRESQKKLLRAEPLCVVRRSAPLVFPPVMRMT